MNVFGQLQQSVIPVSSLSEKDISSTTEQPSNGIEDTDTSIRSALLGDGQFNHNLVAQKLISIGADENAAQLAGERVQNVLLVRTARRRIREFLRERDSLWSASNGQTATISTTMKEQSSTVTAVGKSPPEYGFDDVVDLLLE